jgi:protein SCO1/2
MSLRRSAGFSLQKYPIGAVRTLFTTLWRAPGLLQAKARAPQTCWMLLIGLMFAGVGCNHKSATERSSTTSTVTNLKVFEVKGLVSEVRPRQKEVEIKHEAVPDYMPAMTMPFDVRDTNELAGLQAGDRVIFRLQATDTDAWIDHIRKIGPALPTNQIPTTGEFRLVREAPRVEEGDLLPEYHLTNQFGQAFSTTQFNGQALALTFLFTRCPYPTFCPRMANNFEEAQQKLETLNGGPTNWHLLTVSFDPEFDTPAVLKTYAQFHKYDPAHSTFATGSLIDITALAEQLGLTFWHDENGSISHNLRTVVIGASGRVQKIFQGNEWTSAELVAEIVKAAGR